MKEVSNSPCRHNKTSPAFLIPIALLSCLCTVNAQEQQLDVPIQTWRSLSNEQKDAVLRRFSPNLLDVADYGKIVDVQGIDESTAGTSAGAQLGALVGSASYIDNSLRGRDYSASENVGMALLGGAIGSIFDKSPEKKFTARYAVQRADGEIVYFFETTKTPFKHPLGLCVNLNPFKQIPQNVCSMSKEQLLSVVAGLNSIDRAQKSDVPVASNAEVFCRIPSGQVLKIRFDICEKSGGSAQ